MADPAELDSVAPPRDNGEIVFDAPWERRVFGLTVALWRCGRLEWEAFRQRLIRRIAEHEGVPYWQNWALALEDVLGEAATVTAAELDFREHELLERPAGHDHDR